MATTTSETNKIIGIIPAAGKGSRLAPFPCPKELFPIGYQDYELNGEVHRRPKVVSQYLLERMLLAGVEKFLFSISEGKGDIMKYYGDGSRFNTDIAYLYQENANGMPFAIDLGYEWVKGATIIFGMPDTIIEPLDAFKQLLHAHQHQKYDLTLGLFETNTPSKFGMVEVAPDGTVLSTIDKPSKTHLTLMWGCCCWGHAFTELIHEYIKHHNRGSREIVLGDIFNEALNRKMSVGSLTFVGGQYMDLGTSDELDKALKRFQL